MRGPPVGGTASGGATDTSADSTGPSPATTSGPTTTGEPGESSSDTGQPLDGDVLQNDSWTPADALVWQTWANSGDCWASVLAADPSQYPFEIVGAVVAIGNGDGVHTFEIGVWEVDNQGMPTAALGSALRAAALGAAAPLPLVVLAAWAAVLTLTARRFFRWTS